MSDILPDTALDQLFRQARSYNAFSGEVSEEILRKLYDLLKLGPTEANCCPARIVFVTSDAGKKKLEPALSEGNRDKTMSAPAVAIVGYDMKFYEKLPVLFPHVDAKSWFEGSPEERLYRVALRSSSLQVAYLILAARALGLDAGPMSGFDNDKVDEAFFKGTSIKSNVIINLGKGDPSSLFPRSPRLGFDEAARIE